MLFDKTVILAFVLALALAFAGCGGNGGNDQGGRGDDDSVGDDDTSGDDDVTDDDAADDDAVDDDSIDDDLIDDDAVDDDAVDDDTVDDDTVDDDTVDDDTVDDDTVDDDSIDDDTTPIDCNAVITRQPYLQSVTQTGITVMWGTDIPGDSTVEYGLTDALGQTVYLADQQIVHLVELTGLEPQTTYYYKATSCHDETTVASFRTAPLRDTPFNFTAFSDNHCHAEIFGPFVDMMIGFDPDFAISVGDTVDDGRDPTQYDPCFFTPAQELFRSAPVYVAFGNHEHFSLTYYGLFSFPGGNNAHFSFTYGNTFFLGLDADVPYIPGLPWYKWLVDQLSSPEAQNAEFRVMFFHQPPYTEGWPGYDGDWVVRLFILPLMKQYHVDVYFNGHTHDYERGWDGTIANYIIGGAGGDLDVWARDVAWDLFYASEYHFLHVSVDGATMTLDAIDQTGQVFDSYQIVH